MSLVENQESEKSVDNHSSRSESEEPRVDQKADSSHKKESRDRSHHGEHKERHREDKDSSSKHRSSHHKSNRDDRHRDHRHKESDRHRDRHHKGEEGSRSSKSKRHHSSRERDSHRDRDKKHGKDRSRSVSSERSSHRKKDRHSSHERKSSSRRHDSRDRKSHHRDKDRQKHESSSSRRDERKQDDRSKYTKVVEPSVLSTKASEPAPSLLNPDGTPNAQEILKSIKIPDHLKFNQIEAQKYQMEQLRLKTEELTGIKVPSFYNTAAINPLVYAEQQKKRKLLWSKAKDNGATTTSLIGKAIVEGQDEKTSEKFRKLMGLKSTEEPGGGAGSGANDTTQMKQKFNSIAQAMDKEYEMARMTTHTHRGQGLGFATAGFFDPNQPRPT